MSLPRPSRLRRALLASMALTASALLAPVAYAADAWPAGLRYWLRLLGHGH